MPDQNLVPPPPAAPKNNIPDDVVSELPTNTGSLNDVAPVAVPPPPPSTEPESIAPVKPVASDKPQSMAEIEQLSKASGPVDIPSSSAVPLSLDPKPSPISPPPPLQNKSSIPTPQIPESKKSELLNIKKDALKELSPLVEHLQQEPAEHFQTILDMLRASDDASLVGPAFKAAQAIKNDEQRAKALLEIVKEVNYLTQSKDDTDLVTKAV